MEHFSWSLFILKSEILAGRPIETFFFRIFEIFEYPFLSEYFQKSDWNGIFSQAVGCRLVMQFHSNGTALLYFFGYFSKFFVQLFQNNLMKTSVAISKQSHESICDRV